MSILPIVFLVFYSSPDMPILPMRVFYYINWNTQVSSPEKKSVVDTDTCWEGKREGNKGSMYSLIVGYNILNRGPERFLMEKEAFE